MPAKKPKVELVCLRCGIKFYVQPCYANGLKKFCSKRCHNDSMAVGGLSGPSMSWERTIEDAERRIRRMERQVAELRASVVVFQERRNAGEPFPGQGAEGVR